MDGAQACYPNLAAGAGSRPRRVGGRGGQSDEAQGAIPGRTAPGADLGGKCNSVDNRGKKKEKNHSA